MTMQMLQSLAVMSPNTGDIGQAGLFLGIGGGALALIILCVVMSKKSKK